ncbi:hypothetical protein [Enterobacter asburiae]|uniref:hypothetical protein n=1 Tax=Enterobacter asburiae TaxID=61645 RepID=UPI003BE0479E
MSTEQIIQPANIDYDFLMRTLQNAGMQAELKNERIILTNGKTKATVRILTDVITFFSYYKIKPDVERQKLLEMIYGLNQPSSFNISSITKNQERLSISMAYLTSSGVFIPHFIHTINGFFAFQRISLKKNNLSDILE